MHSFSCPSPPPPPGGPAFAGDLHHRAARHLHAGLGHGLFEQGLQHRSLPHGQTTVPIAFLSHFGHGREKFQNFLFIVSSFFVSFTFPFTLNQSIPECGLTFSQIHNMSFILTTLMVHDCFDYISSNTIDTCQTNAGVRQAVQRRQADHAEAHAPRRGYWPHSWFGYFVSALFQYLRSILFYSKEAIIKQFQFE